MLTILNPDMIAGFLVFHPVIVRVRSLFVLIPTFYFPDQLRFVFSQT